MNKQLLLSSGSLSCNSEFYFVVLMFPNLSKKKHLLGNTVDVLKDINQ